MTENKTTRNDASVTEFLDKVENDTRRADAYAMLHMMREVTGEEPAMWGDSIVGFGDRHLRYASGREIDWFLVGFSPRKASLTLYLINGVGNEVDLLAKLGKHKTGVGCLYVNKLADVDQAVLRELIATSWNAAPPAAA